MVTPPPSPARRGRSPAPAPRRRSRSGPRASRAPPRGPGRRLVCRRPGPRGDALDARGPDRDRRRGAGAGLRPRLAGEDGGVTMRAVVYRGPRDLVVADVGPRPLGAGDVRVAVDSAGVCGTDVRIFKGEHSGFANGTGRVPGHEVVGRVSELGQGVSPPGVAVGDVVFVAPNIGCGVCAQCRRGNENLCPATEAIGISLDGGFAESVLVPARAVEHGNLIPLGSVSPDAGVLIE